MEIFNASTRFETRIDYLFWKQSSQSSFISFKYLMHWGTQSLKEQSFKYFFPSFPYWHLSVPLTWEQMVRKELNASKDPNSFFYEFLAKNHLCIVFFPKYIFICIYMHFSFPTLFPETTGNRENREKLSEKNNSLALEKNTKHNKTSIVDHMENAHWQPCLVFKIL